MRACVKWKEVELLRANEIKLEAVAASRSIVVTSLYAQCYYYYYYLV